MSYAQQQVKLTMSESVSSKSYALGWFICGLGALYYAYEYFLRISPSVMELPLRQHYMLDASGFGLLSAFYYYAYVPMQLPVGVLMDRYGPRRLLSLACLSCVVGSFLFVSTDSFWVAALGRFLVGFGSSFAFVGVLKLGTIWLPENKLGMVAGLSAGLGSIGAWIGDNLLGAWVASMNWQHTINMTAFAGIGLVFILWFFLRDTPSENYPTYRTNNQEDSFSHSMQDVKAIISNKQIWVNGIYGSFVYLPTTVVAELWGPSYLHYAHGMSHKAADFGNSLLFLGFTFGAPLMGLLSDKLKRRRLPMQIGAIGALICLSTVFYTKGLATNVVYLLMFITGLFYGAQAIVFAVGREMSPVRAGGTAMAITNMIVMLGGMILQPTVGFILDFSNKLRNGGALETVVQETGHQLSVYSASDYQYALAIVPIGIIASFIATFFLKETNAKLSTH